MIEVYSKNVTVPSDTSVPLNNVSIKKTDAVKLSGVSTLQFNKCGVYHIHVNAVAVAQAVGAISIQLSKDGTLIPQAFSAITASDTTLQHPLSFDTLVQVSRNNNPNCMCSSPTDVELMNTGVETLFELVDVTVV